MYTSNEIKGIMNVWHMPRVSLDALKKYEISNEYQCTIICGKIKHGASCYESVLNLLKPPSSTNIATSLFIVGM